MSLTQVDLRIEYNHPLTARFNPEAHCVAEMYWSYLRDYDSGKVKKCVVQLSNQWGDKLHQYTNWADVKMINLYFNFQQYFAVGEKERKSLSLKAVHQGMLMIAEKEEWGTEKLKAAYDQCVENDLNYQFYVGKAKASPDRKHKINFWCNWQLSVFELYWVLLDKKEQEIQKVKLLELDPAKGEFAYYLKWKWLDPETVLLQNTYRYSKLSEWKIKPFN